MTTINPKAVLTNQGLGKISKHNAYPVRKDYSVPDLAHFTKDPPAVRAVTDHEFTDNGGEFTPRMHNDYPMRKNGPTPDDLKPFRNSPPRVNTECSAPVVKVLESNLRVKLVSTPAD